MEIKIEVQGLGRAKKVLENLQNFTDKNYQKIVMTTIGEMTRNKIEESFESKTSPFGEVWKPLKQTTLKAKKNKGDILRFSGSLADRWNIKATSSRVEVFGNSVNKKAYAYGAVHQFGTNKAGKSKNIKIPKRAFLPIDDSGAIEKSLKKDIEDLLIDELKNKIN